MILAQNLVLAEKVSPLVDRRETIFLGFNCPARSPRVKGGPSGRRYAIGFADP
jgi:hypothetical protein